MPDQDPPKPEANRFTNRIRYRFDNLLARGTWAVLLWLGVITLAAVLLSSLMLAALQGTLAGSQDQSWVEGFWQSLMRAMDPGTMADDVGWGERVAALLVTTAGILIAGTLIGLIASGIEQRLRRMQRGRSMVVESGHVVILGASTRLPVVVQQLTLANVSRKSKAIVVLAEREPAELNEEVRAVIPDTQGSRLVFRWGDPTRPTDLATAAIRQARAVIALADEEARGDAGVVKAVLATGAEMNGFGKVPIVAELSDPATANVLVQACGTSVYAVVTLEAVARMALFALREPGLNQVVEELVDYRGADVYVRDRADLVGLPFGQILVHFSNARPIGRIRVTGEIDLNPPRQAVFEQGDRLVVIADDEGRLEVAPADLSISGVATPAAPLELDHGLREEHFLVIGWNTLGGQLMSKAGQVATPDSTIQVVYDATLFAAEDVGVPHPQVTTIPTRKRAWLLGDMDETNHLTTIILLGYRRGMSVEEADSRTLLNLMLLQQELKGWAGTPPRVLVEILDSSNVALARMMGADDYLVSDAIGSRLMVQLAEEPERRPILLKLYSPEGPSIHLVAAERLGLGGERTAAEVYRAAASAGLIAIGWRDAIERGGKATLNPKANDRIVFQEGDQIVVIG